MNKYILYFIFSLPILSFGQFSLFGETEPTGEPDVYYYKFYNDIQMVEFDYLSAYHRRLNYLEQAQPRALSWAMVLGPPPPNVYIFRNKSGEIVKQYGDIDQSKLLSVHESMKNTIFHNSFFAQLGSVVGFTQISTRYFPYYLISNQYNGLGLIDSLGNEVLPPIYSAIWKHDNIFITLGSIYELRDKNLKVTYSSNEFQLQPSQEHRGYADILKDNKCGLMDSVGRIVVPCKYDMLVGSFNEYGLAKVKRNGRIGYVDTSGNEVIECKYQSDGYFKEGLLDVRYEDKWGYIDTNGVTVIPHKYDIGIWFEEGLARVAKRKDGEFYFGFIDKEGNEVIPLIYSDAKDFSNGVAEVMLNGKWIEIDKRGVRQ